MSLIKLAYNLEQSFEPQMAAGGLDLIRNTSQLEKQPDTLYDRVPLKLKLQMMQKRKHAN